VLTIPPDVQEATALYRAMFHLQQPGNPCNPLHGWLQQQLTMLDVDNRMETDDIVYKQRQGAAQAISQIIDHINKAKDEVLRLEGRA